MAYLYFTTATLKTFVAKLKSTFAAISHNHSISAITNLQTTLDGKATLTDIAPLQIESMGKVRLMFIDKEAYLVAEEGYLQNEYTAYLFRWTKSRYQYKGTNIRSKHIGWIAPQKGYAKITLNIIRTTLNDAATTEEKFRIYNPIRVRDSITMLSLLDYLLTLEVTDDPDQNFYITDKKCALRICDENGYWVTDYLPFMIKSNPASDTRGIGRWHK